MPTGLGRIDRVAACLPRCDAARRIILGGCEASHRNDRGRPPTGRARPCHPADALGVRPACRRSPRPTAGRHRLGSADGVAKVWWTVYSAASAAARALGGRPEMLAATPTANVPRVASWQQVVIVPRGDSPGAAARKPCAGQIKALLQALEPAPALLLTLLKRLPQRSSPTLQATHPKRRSGRSERSNSRRDQCRLRWPNGRRGNLPSNEGGGAERVCIQSSSETSDRIQTCLRWRSGGWKPGWACCASVGFLAPRASPSVAPRDWNPAAW